ncbi:MAG: hypothetical protein EOP01_00090 [Propionibacteriaceae bacterium]|nr:MAG: hypothetical protein EOP01_00090 [Propionibacteriaceae bacterium]
MTETLAATSARRTACTLLVTGPLIGILWLHFLVPGQPPTALLARQPVVGLLIAVSASCSALTVRIVSHPSHLSRCGRPARWGPTRTVAAACATAALGDALLLTIGLDAMATGRATLIAAAAVTTSLLRLILSQKAARRDLVR